MSHALYELLTELEMSKIHFTIARFRPDTVLVSLCVVGARIEIDVFEDGHMEVSLFKGNEDIAGGAELVRQLISEYAD